MAGYQLDGQSHVPTVDAAFLSASMGPFVALTFRCAAGGAVPFFTLETKGECQEWLPNWSAGYWDVKCRRNWRWSAAPTSWAACRHWDSGASSSEVVTEVSALLPEHVGPAPDLAVEERNHGRSLTKSA